MEKHGTPSATQIGKLLREIINAVTAVIEEFDIKDILKSLQGKSEQFAGMMKLVFIAMTTNMYLVLQNPVEGVWFTVEFKKYKTAASLRDAVWSSRKVKLYQLAFRVMKSPLFGMVSKVDSVALVKISLTNFGLYRDATFEEIKLAAFNRFKLQLCPPELGPRLALQIDSKLLPCDVYIGMQSIDDGFGKPVIFQVNSNHLGQINLTTVRVGENITFEPDAQFVFIHRVNYKD